jgi:hypothetical protein
VPQESDRNRFETDSASSREHDSWSNNTNPGCDGRAFPNTKSSEQHPSPSFEPAASDGAKKAFFSSFKSLHPEFRALLKRPARS